MSNTIKVIKVSVILPIYNMERYLEGCLESISAQTLPDIEIICVDDGSSDGTPDILRRYKNNDGRFVVITQENQGPGTARNNGIAAAKGKFIAFMDPDDWYPSNDTLRSLVSAAEENGAQICGGSFSSYFNGIANAPYQGDYQNYTFTEQGMVRYADYQYDYGYTRFIYSRELILSNNILFPDYRRFQDPPFFVRAMCAAEEFYAVPQVTYCYRTGHQDYNWSEEKTVGAIKGMTENLNLAKQYGLEKLHRRTFLRFAEEEMLKCICRHLKLGSQPVLHALIAANAAADMGLLMKAKAENIEKADGGTGADGADSEFWLLPPLVTLLTECSVPKEKRESQLYELECITSSNSYRIGQAITFLPRKIRGGVLCVKDHGVIYTAKLTASKFGIGKIGKGARKI